MTREEFEDEKLGIYQKRARAVYVLWRYPDLSEEVRAMYRDVIDKGAVALLSLEVAYRMSEKGRR